jgi:hypothetical protein
MTLHSLTTQTKLVRNRASFMIITMAAMLTACASDEVVAPDGATSRNGLTSMGGAASQIAGLPCPKGTPDLAVTALLVGNAKATGEVDVRATVKNVGTGCAGVFRIEGAEWWGGTQTLYGLLTVVPNSSISASGYTLHTLLPGETVAFSGTVRLPLVQSGQPAVLLIVADGCLDPNDGSLPKYCRVAETLDIDNNRLSAVVAIP